MPLQGDGHGAGVLPSSLSSARWRQEARAPAPGLEGRHRLCHY